MKRSNYLVALAGQPNCGKSTVFNSLTGASQHVANYPGVTVDKMVGWYKYNGDKIELVDLPGTYSLTSFSPEERVARDFVLYEKPSVTVNVIDASNLSRSLYLTFQLMEMEIPLILNLNMIDVTDSHGIEINISLLSRLLQSDIVSTAIKSGRGKKDILRAITSSLLSTDPKKGIRIDYTEMEPFVRKIEKKLSTVDNIASKFPLRWLAVKLIEGDREVQNLLSINGNQGSSDVIQYAESLRADFENTYNIVPGLHIAQRRYQTADNIAQSCISLKSSAKKSWSNIIDRFVCHRVMGPLILIGIIWLLYYLSIVQGYNITNYTWPILAKIRSFIEVFLPLPGFIDIPLGRSFVLWVVDSINALLNYIPIFFILFGLIAILEDSGYMPRMAFIMDRLLNRFGLHGQSTLPMILGGVYVGGCAVPGVMSCKGIPDERSRFATIMIIPLLNCLAKVPLYVLLINIYFAQHKALAMFFISTISLLIVLPVAKILTLTVLKHKKTAPFVMEMPSYHIPTIRGVLGCAFERVWLFIRKITTIVAVVAVIVFALLQFPGLSDDRMAYFAGEKEKATTAFFRQIQNAGYADYFRGEQLMAFINYWEEYNTARLQTKSKDALVILNEKFKKRNPVFFKIVLRGNGEKEKRVFNAAKKLIRERKGLLKEMQKERINNSLLGKFGKALEPVTQWAGFNWRVNVALLSALAAKESSVATLGALYEQSEPGQTLEQRMEKEEKGFTPLHALSLMLFMVLYPPCLATAIAVKLQAGSMRWMLFSMIYPMILGLLAASLVFSAGKAFSLSGLQAMVMFYGVALGITVLMGCVKNKSEYT